MIAQKLAEISAALVLLKAQAAVIPPSYTPYVPTEQEQMKGIIRYWSSVYSIDEKMMIFLAEIESNLNPRAKNPNSTATGLFQFLKGTWDAHCEGERTNPNDNAKCAMELYKEHKLAPWCADIYTKQKLKTQGYNCS